MRYCVHFSPVKLWILILILILIFLFVCCNFFRYQHICSRILEYLWFFVLFCFSKRIIRRYIISVPTDFPNLRMVSEAYKLYQYR